ncbi:hypothetical protein FC83_GL002249 [Agrilactobacillus composti DSM 18527 = JCM 14202]|uniref:YlxR domain-containing protein n=1 Tax=Agrilactobacillus composti DSM 18527 = JCM 14202 TaxID=1423734 RepID=X0PT88_9LACO|nr:YlxR family protein [Agrilactobacillus composti]KRM36845.1 hypothetical protein FC83_GL002249 [Agrilactobacillus composti DSM 18527 = JCM 14202]GAF41212.1 predicted nucleic-acid-binding protein implicated in transcription termination [Agrilactobacillus composti DSM 18527 = JCM 14202]
MKKRKIPMRKDVLTDEMHPKKEMVRVVRNKEGEVSLDPTGKKPGRGAYVSLNPEAVKAAKEKRTLDTVFEVKISDDFYDELFEYVDHKKARQELFGND